MKKTKGEEKKSFFHLLLLFILFNIWISFTSGKIPLSNSPYNNNNSLLQIFITKKKIQKRKQYM